ncbi:condensation domain-containing protein, partial [Alteromonas sp. ASW11-130]|uniref:condensation domain-containing protein n=1 Tax=Alteromonas sp. ASW11-130 TaxID=3015775 RepID=UPI002241CC87
MNSTFPLTLTQRDIFFDQMYYIDSPLYNIGGYIKCSGIDIDRMQAAHKQLALSHDVFGIRIVQRQETVCQYISEDRSFELPVYDFSKEGNPEQHAIDWLNQRFQQKIDFIDRQLCFGYLLKLTKEDYWYVGLSHHLAMDGWGFSNWSYKLAEYYNKPDQKLVVEQEGLSYQEMSESDQKYLKSKRYESDKTFWREHFESSGEKLLTAYYKSQFSNVKYVPSTRYRHYINRDVFAACCVAANEVGVGVPQFILGVLAYYFSAVCDTNQVAFGIPAHNRKNHKQKNKVGVFTSVSTLNVDVPGSITFQQLVQGIAKLQKASFRHQRFPVGDLMSTLNSNSHERSLYDVSFNYLKLDYGELTFGSSDASVIYHASGFDTTPLTVTIWDGDDEDIEMQLDYNHAYFSNEEVQGLADRFYQLLHFFSQQTNLARPLSELPVLAESEKTKLIAAISHTQNNYPHDVCVHELFEQQAAVRPDAVALV